MSAGAFYAIVSVLVLVIIMLVCIIRAMHAQKDRKHKTSSVQGSKKKKGSKSHRSSSMHSGIEMGEKTLTGDKSLELALSDGNALGIGIVQTVVPSRTPTNELNNLGENDDNSNDTDEDRRLEYGEGPATTGGSATNRKSGKQPGAGEGAGGLAYDENGDIDVEELFVGNDDQDDDVNESMQNIWSGVQELKQEGNRLQTVPSNDGIDDNDVGSDDENARDEELYDNQMKEQDVVSSKGGFTTKEKRGMSQHL